MRELTGVLQVTLIDILQAFWSLSSQLLPKRPEVSGEVGVIQT